MIQISFEPAFDPLHTIFRLLRLRPIIHKVGSLNNDHVRILDFFLLFPFRVTRIRLKQAHRGKRSIATEYSDRRPYGEMPDDRILFDRMQPMQDAALQSLASWRLIDAERLQMGEVLTTSEEVQAALSVRIEQANTHDATLLSFLELLASDYSLLGSNGLKDRTGLLEHRYDAV